MAMTPINSEDRLVQATFAEHLERVLGWDSIYAWNEETFGPDGTFGRADTKQAVLIRDLRTAMERLNPDLPVSTIDDAMRDLTAYDISRSMVQHNRDFYRLLRGGVPVEYRDAQGRRKSARARVIDFDNAPGSNRFLAVRELKLTGIRTPNYNRRADLVCFVNGLPLVFIELKAVYKNIHEGFDGNLSDYMDENVIAHAFHHNAFLIVSNGDRARYGSITSKWEHFAEWKAARRGGQGQPGSRGTAERDAGARSAAGHCRKLHPVRREQVGCHAESHCAKPPGTGGQPGGGVRGATGRTEAGVPAERRLKHRVVELPLESRAPTENLSTPADGRRGGVALHSRGAVDIVERAHPELGRLGVFWHTQGSGKSYSMASSRKRCGGGWKAISRFC